MFKSWVVGFFVSFLGVFVFVQVKAHFFSSAVPPLPQTQLQKQDAPNILDSKTVSDGDMQRFIQKAQKQQSNALSKERQSPYAREYIRKNIKPELVKKFELFKNCYVAYLGKLAAPTLRRSGHLKASWTVNTRGETTQVLIESNSFGDKPFAACTQAAIEKIYFQPPTQSVEVSHQFYFKPEDESP